MSYLLVFILLTVTFASNETVADDDQCEKIKNFDWFRVGSHKTCHVSSSMSITSEGVKLNFPKDETIAGFKIDWNTKIEFLPIRIHETYPNLVAYSGASCMIKNISRANFEKMDKLQYLDLGSNRLEVIPTSAFYDLVELRALYLVANKIKYMNGEAFARLSKLERVWMTWNKCMDKKIDPVDLPEFQREVSIRCGFEEAEQEEDAAKQS